MYCMNNDLFTHNSRGKSRCETVDTKVAHKGMSGSHVYDHPYSPQNESRAFHEQILAVTDVLGRSLRYVSLHS